MSEKLGELMAGLAFFIVLVPILTKLYRDNPDIDLNLWPAFFILLAIYALVMAKRLIKTMAVNNARADFSVLLVRLPKDKPKDQEKTYGVQQLREEIARGETLFASIGGLRADRSLNSWLFGRSDHFSFEIVATNQKIAFYIVTPKDKTRYIEQQIHAHYSDAAVEEVDDYNAFDPRSEVVAGFLKTKKEFIFPLRTYNKMEVDPLNAIINIMSKLDKGESLVIQYVIRSSHPKWHERIKRVVRKAHKTNSMRLAIRPENIFNGLRDLFGNMKKKEPTAPENQKRLTSAEEEMLKAMEEKNSKSGLDVNLRIISVAKTKEKALMYLNNVSDTYSTFNNYEYGNTFIKISRKNQNMIVRDFIYRHFKEKTMFLLNSEEMTGLFHLPLKDAETPNILWLTAKNAPAPSELPTEGLILGYNVYRGVKREVKIKKADRRRHTYIIGKSGVGKSVLLTNMAVQDVLNGDGVCVLDPHGDLIEDILCRIPPERAEDVIIFSPSDTERPLALNLLEYDQNYPEQKGFVINEMIGIFDKLYDLKATGGPMFEQYMRNAMLLIMDDPDSGSTLMEIPKVLADENFRQMKLRKCKNQTVVDFWRDEAEKAGGEAALANIVPYITSKLTPFIANDMMRPIIGQQKSSFSLRDVMDKQKILLVELPKGLIGETNAYLLGMILVGKILMAALSRADMKDKAARKDFYLYIDEFQNFTTNSICQILSEARKYALNLVIAHQYIGQLSKGQDTQIKDAVFGNVGTMVSFKIGSEDAQFLVKEFAPVFNEFDLVNVGAGTAYLKLLIDNSATRPFSMQTPWPVMGMARDGVVEKYRALRLIYPDKE
nr:type IV secretion system DNA-binding domain-containing protein [Planctomycetota bacterium]